MSRDDGERNKGLGRWLQVGGSQGRVLEGGSTGIDQSAKSVQPEASDWPLPSLPPS